MVEVSSLTRLSRGGAASGCNRCHWLRTIHAVVLGCWVLAGARAHADANMFGAAGQYVPFGRVGVEFALAGGAPGARGELGKDLSVQVCPGLMSFFARNLAWGVGLDIRYADYELPTWPFTELELGASAAFGVHVPLSELVGVFPQLWIGGGYLRREYLALIQFPLAFTDPTYQSSSESGLTFEGPYLSGQLVLPLVFNVARATIISVGPHARMQWVLEQAESGFVFGISAGVGRYF
jgi:hypothetical protein